MSNLDLERFLESLSRIDKRSLICSTAVYASISESFCVCVCGSIGIFSLTKKPHMWADWIAIAIADCSLWWTWLQQLHSSWMYLLAGAVAGVFWFPEFMMLVASKHGWFFLLSFDFPFFIFGSASSRVWHWLQGRFCQVDGILVAVDVFEESVPWINRGFIYLQFLIRKLISPCSNRHVDSITCIYLREFRIEIHINCCFISHVSAFLVSSSMRYSITKVCDGRRNLIITFDNCQCVRFVLVWYPLFNG